MGNAGGPFFARFIVVGFLTTLRDILSIFII